MKQYFLFQFIIIILTACNSTDSNITLQRKIDSLQKQIDNAYKPGLGEFMSSIQVHHAKLWFAGTNANWQLADFEIHEIMEAVDDIQQYNIERPESKEIKVIVPGIDSVLQSIKIKDAASFKNSFILLTNTCNNCHKAVQYDFNQVKIPDEPPFSNQVFTPAK